MGEHGQIKLYTPKKSSLQILNNMAAFVLAFCCLTPTFVFKTYLVLIAIAVWGWSAVFGLYGTAVLNSKRTYMYFGMIGWLLITAAMMIFRPEMNAGGLYTGLLTSVICIETLRNNLISKDFSVIKRLAFFSLILYVLILGRALFLGGTDSNVYRLNKASGVMNESIGNFGLYYLVVFTLPLGLFFAFKKKIKHRWLVIALAVVSLLLLLFAQYTIAFIVEIALLLIWLVIKQTKGNRSMMLMWLILIGIFIMTLVLFSDIILIKPLEALANSISQDSPMRERLMDVVKTLQGDVSEDNLAVDRLSRYGDSWKSFFQHPILGGNIYQLLGLTNGDVAGKAGHNSVIELFNQYGLLFGVPYYLLMITQFKRLLTVWKKVDYGFYSLLTAVVVAYFILGLLNPIFNLFAMTWLLFNVLLVAPLIFSKRNVFEAFCEEFTLGNGL